MDRRAGEKEKLRNWRLPLAGWEWMFSTLWYQAGRIFSIKMRKIMRNGAGDVKPCDQRTHAVNTNR